MDSDHLSRSDRKREVILEASTAAFLNKGYLGASMDDVARLAAVSKQTVYKHFTDKEQLFHEMVLGIVGNTVDRFAAVLDEISDTNEIEQDLGELARVYVRSVMQPQVLQLRRLVIGEASRFPELGRAYYERGPERSLVALAACLRRLSARGLLRIEDSTLAASHFAYLILSAPLDRAMVCGDDSVPEPELDRFAESGVKAFLAAYH
jgi:TetR/AcrR family transcriptional repressor of mexJK operon